MSNRTVQSVETDAVLTTHAGLIPLGVFAQRIGLVEALEQVPIAQRTREHTPQCKLIEFLVATLAGCAHLKDISRGPHPLDHDSMVAQAWGQRGWADHSGVSRTLWACDEASLVGIERALEQISRPFLQAEVTRALNETGYLTVDFDLTARPVAVGSTSYPQARFGWMGDAVAFGMQAAMVSLHAPTYGRLWLDVRQHPGDVAATALTLEMVEQAERAMGVRPRRRVDRAQQRRQEAQQTWEQTQQAVHQAQEQVEQAEAKVAASQARVQHWETQAKRLKKAWKAKGRKITPGSRPARAAQRLTAARARLAGRIKKPAQAQQQLIKTQQKLAQRAQEMARLQAWCDRLEADNADNPDPVSVRLRVDAAWGGGESVALLIELGYELFTKARNAQVTGAVRGWVQEPAAWTRVGANAEMIAFPQAQLSRCPYPLDVGLERFWQGKKQAYAVLLHYGDTPVVQDLPGWFATYNARQTIEAGIKEGKGIFQMHHLKVRAPFGLQIQERFAAFAANLVRWCAHWLDQVIPEPPLAWPSQPVGVKEWVQVACHTTAWVQRRGQDWGLRFTPESAYADVQVWLLAQTSLIQWRLPFYHGPTR